MSRPGIPGPAAVDDVTPLERELREALSVEPSAEFLPRVRERLARERAVRRWRRAGWLLPAAAAIAVAAAVLVVRDQALRRAVAPVQREDAPTTVETRSTTPTIQSAAPSESATSLAPPDAVGSGRRTAVFVKVVRHAARGGATVDSQMAPILVSPRAELALQRFAESIRGRNVGSETVLSASVDTLSPDPHERVAVWPVSEGRVRHIDEAGWNQLEPVVMDN